MKKIPLFLVLVFSSSCGTAGHKREGDTFSARQGTLVSGGAVDLRPVLPLLNQAEWRPQRQPFTVWKTVSELTLPDGSVLQITSATAAFRLKGEKGEYYLRAEHAGRYLAFVNEALSRG